MKDLCLTDESFVKLKSLILHENLRQLEKWGVQDHLPSEWLMFATEELGECAKAIGEWNYRCGSVEDVVKEYGNKVGFSRQWKIKDMRYFKAKPTWINLSDFSQYPPKEVEFNFKY